MKQWVKITRLPHDDVWETKRRIWPFSFLIFLQNWTQCHHARRRTHHVRISPRKNFKHTLFSIVKGTIVMAHQKNEHTLHTVHFLSNLLRQHELNLIFLGISGHNDNPRLKLELHMNAFFCLYFSRILCILSNRMKRHWFNIKGFPWLFKAPLMKIGKITRC